jgi:hypothetical protein
MTVTNANGRVLVSLGRCVYLGPRGEDLRMATRGTPPSLAREVAIYFDPSRGWTLLQLGHGLVLLGGRAVVRRTPTRLCDATALWVNGTSFRLRLHRCFVLLVREPDAAAARVRTRLITLPTSATG